MRFRVIGMNSVISAVNRCEAWAVDGMAGSGSTGHRVVISCAMSRVIGTGRALRAAASAHPFFLPPGQAWRPHGLELRFVRHWSWSVLGQRWQHRIQLEPTQSSDQ